tara:strand:+ start:682 stop:849 length:168 start_codon:yes stop_codon:yes gene_type:complete
MANKKTKSTTMESALQKAVEEQENSETSARIKRLLARKKNLLRRKRAKLPPTLRK